MKIKDRRAQTVTEFARTPKNGRALSREENRELVRPQIKRTERSRLRGVRVMRRSDGTVGEQIVGQRIYLPNIIFTLVSNHTPAGKPYNPYEATFHIPQNITKTDVRSYLHSIYGVECTYIRTDNYLVSMKYKKALSIGRLEDKNNKRAYKRAVVGLKQPFYYPLMVEDMNGKDRWLREATLEDTFRLKDMKLIQNAMSVKVVNGTRENNIDALAQNWDTRKNILRKLHERREERESAARDFAKRLEAMK